MYFVLDNEIKYGTLEMEQICDIINQYKTKFTFQWKLWTKMKQTVQEKKQRLLKLLASSLE